MKVFNKFFSDKHLAKSFPLSMAAKKVRVNGNLGMGNDFDPATWKLKVEKTPGDTLFLTLDDIKTLPKTNLFPDDNTL